MSALCVTSVALRRRSGGDPMALRWRSGGAPVSLRWCSGGALVTLRWRPGGVSLALRWRSGGAPVAFMQFMQFRQLRGGRNVSSSRWYLPGRIWQDVWGTLSSAFNGFLIRPVCSGRKADGRE